MSQKQSDKDQIEKYLNGLLTGIDLDVFQNRMQNDLEFQQEVYFQKIVRSGIQLALEGELRKKIMETIRYRNARVPFSLKLIFTFLFITVAGITLWFYVETESNDKNHTHFILPFIKNKIKPSESKQAESKSKNAIAEKQNSKTADADVIQNDDSKIAKINAEKEVPDEQKPVQDTTELKKSDDQDIVIKKDQLLITTSLPVTEKGDGETKSADNVSLSQETVDKLNPAAGIPEEAKQANNLQVEFWVSPVNYRGYKMSKNKIILFGIEEPEAVKLYKLNNMLYMKYGNEFFKLTNTFDFLSYQRLKDSDVPLTLKQ
jgi:hypothetical protein